MSYGCTHGKAAQRSNKDEVKWSHLQPRLVPSWRGASRIIWNCWKPRGISSPARAAALATLLRQKAGMPENEWQTFFPNFLGALFIKSTEMNPSRTVSNETLSTWKIWPYLSLTLCQGKPRNSGEGLSRIRSEIPRVIITPEKNSPIKRVSLLIDGLWQTDNFSVI